MKKLGLWFQGFMRGRYGADTLYWWSMGAILVLWILRTVFAILRLGLIADILNLLITVILVLAVFRLFSRNIYKRSAENRKFNEILKKTKLDLIPNMIRDRKTHIYKVCPKCKSSLRLPRRQGEHTVRCPKCSERFQVKIK